MVRVIGVDFSGAGKDDEVGNTWITEGLVDQSALTLNKPVSISRENLTERLKRRDYSVAAMDFPFSVPKDLAKGWDQNAREMPELWSAVASMKLCTFRAKIKSYAQKKENGKKHPLRIGDLYSTKPLSCLNSRMVPMTFYGMKMLHRLDASEETFQIPPLGSSDQKAPLLLEVMPGAALEALSLPSERYKEVTKTIKKGEINSNRKKILNGLERKSKIKLNNLDCYSKIFQSHHDAIDSLVAVVVAAMWELDKPFRCPSETSTVKEASASPQRLRRISPGINHWKERDVARLEGWIYVPSCQ